MYLWGLGWGLIGAFCLGFDDDRRTIGDNVLLVDLKKGITR